MKNESFRKWSVVGGIIRRDSNFLLVANRRGGSLHSERRGGIDWTPPGGVVDYGESPLEALKREVLEETGLQVSIWSDLTYGVSVAVSYTHLTLPTKRIV